MIAVLAMVIFCYAFGWNPPFWVSIFAGLALGCLVPQVGRRIARAEYAEELAHEYLRLELCPSCAYDLDAIVPGANDLRTCPECGAAWKTPRHGSPT